MKIKSKPFRILLILSVQFIALCSMAQVPALINYQGIVRDNNGVPVSNQAIALKFEVLQGSSSGPVVYTDNQASGVSTNAYGLFTTQIGKSSGFGQVNWQQGVSYYLKIWVDPAGGTNLVALGNPQQISSVPYAFHAQTVPATYSNNILSIGNRTFDITPSITSVPNTSITLSGLGTITSAGTNSFDINIPAPTFTNTGQQIITGTYPNYTVNTPTVPASSVPTIAITNTAAATSAVQSSGNSFNINVPPPSFTNTGQQIITGTYPNYSVNTPSTVSTSTLIGSGIAAVTPSVGNNFVVNVPTPVFTNAGQNIVTGTYPNFTVNTPTVATMPTLIAAGLATVSGGPNYTVGVSPLTYTPSTGSLGSGTNVVVVAPTLSLSGNTLSSGPNTNSVLLPTSHTIVGQGLAAITPSSGSSFTVTVNQPTFAYSNTTGSLTSGTSSAYVTPALGLSGTTLTSGPSSNSVNLTNISPWIQTGGTVALVTTSNNVSIGGSNPTAKLEVAGGKLAVAQSAIRTTTQMDADANTSILGVNGITENIDGDLYLRSYWGTLIDRHGGNAFGATATNFGNGAFAVRYKTAINTYRTDFLINDFGNVGIGTTNANAPLQFANSTANRKIVLYETVNNDHQFYGLGINNSTLRYQVDNVSADHIFYAGTSATTSQELMRIEGTGRVGIGTSSPATNLHINSTSNFTQVRLTHTATASFGLVLGSDATSAALLNYDNTPMYFGTNGANRMLISNTGNVNIGTFIPAQKLNVDGNISLEDAAASTAPARTIGFPIASTGNHGALTIQAKSQVFSGTAFGGGNLLIAGGDYNVGSANPTGSFGGNVTIQAGHNLWPHSTGALIVFQAGTTANTERMRIDGLTGNVGIGTSAPTDLLTVNGSASKPGGGSWAVFSDRRLKKDINSYKDGLKELMKIEPVWYTYNGEANIAQETFVGVIAQDLQLIAPYMVKETNREVAGATNYLSVDNSAMTYMLINAVKEQQKQIEELKKTVADLQKNK